jgi:hypothetical protein
MHNIGKCGPKDFTGKLLIFNGRSHKSINIKKNKKKVKKHKQISSRKKKIETELTRVVYNQMKTFTIPIKWEHLLFR